jgi:hypothetical protein
MTTRRHIRRAVEQHARDRAAMAPILGRIPTRADYAIAATPAHRGNDRSLDGYPGPGAINAYRCKDCHDVTVVRHVDQGVTPMFLACRVTDGCQGMAVSAGYQADPAQLPPPTFEWYRPTGLELAKLDFAMQDYVRRGGLELRPVAA